MMTTNLSKALELLNVTETGDPNDKLRLIQAIQSFADKKEDAELVEACEVLSIAIRRTERLKELESKGGTSVIYWTEERPEERRVWYYCGDACNFASIVPHNSVPTTTGCIAVGDPEEEPDVDKDIAEQMMVLRKLRKYAEISPERLPFYQDNCYAKYRQNWYDKDGKHLQVYS